MKHFVVENPGCFLMPLGVLSHFMVSRAAHVVLRISDASSQEVPQVTKTILMAANSFRNPPPIPFFRHWYWTLSPSLDATCNRSRANAKYFPVLLRCPAACVHVFCSFYAFLGVGGGARERKRMGKKKKCWIFHANAHASGTRMSA